MCVAARVGGGWQADLRPGRQVGVIAGLLACGALGLLLLALPGPVPLMLGVVLGFGLGWSWPGLMNFAVVRLHPQAPAAATSITQTGVYAGGCVGPLGLGRSPRPRLPHDVDGRGGGHGHRRGPDARRQPTAAAPPLMTPTPLVRPLSSSDGSARPTAQLVRSAMKSQSASIARFGSPSGSGASWARASSA